jgi:hypothetical protein
VNSLRPRIWLQPHTGELPPVLMVGNHKYELNVVTAAYLAGVLNNYIYDETRKKNPEPSYCLWGDQE